MLVNIGFLLSFDEKNFLFEGNLRSFEQKQATGDSIKFQAHKQPSQAYRTDYITTKLLTTEKLW